MLLAPRIQQGVAQEHHDLGNVLIALDGFEDPRGRDPGILFQGLDLPGDRLWQGFHEERTVEFSDLVLK